MLIPDALYVIAFSARGCRAARAQRCQLHSASGEVLFRNRPNVCFGSEADFMHSLGEVCFSPRVDVPWWNDIGIGLPKPLVRDGFIEVSDKPGLGIDDIDDAVISQHLPPGAKGIWEPTDQWDDEWSWDRTWS